MTKEEFESRLVCLGCEKKVSKEEFDIVNYVYTFHPAISEVEGKDQVAWLFVNLGMRVFNDMTETAKTAEDLEARMRSLEHEMDAYEAEYVRLKTGFVKEVSYA